MINPVISNSYLPRVISEGCGVVQGIPPYEHQYNNNTDHIHLEEEYSRRSVDESTRKADEALKELEITRNQSNISAPVTHYNGPVAVISQQVCLYYCYTLIMTMVTCTCIISPLSYRYHPIHLS